MIVYSFEMARDELGNSNQGNYLYNYLKNLKTNTLVIEENYIDKDYLIDYSKFYARSFRNHERFTKRLHFFSESFSIENFRQALINGNVEFLDKLKDSYLGFVVIKPIKDLKRNPLIGRTILRTYPFDINNHEHRVFLTGKYSASLFGILLSVESLPFQAQDIAVGACATTALWVSLHPLHERFEVLKYSPFEITEMSVLFPGEERNFPSSGLELRQIKNYFNTIGLETEIINVEKSKTKELIADAVKAYINERLPIIATLILKKGGREDYHAVVISGYRHENGILKELYIHDDQIGPYSRVIFEGDFTRWKNEWVEDYGYEEVIVEKLLVPIYPKIRSTFGRMYNVFLEYKKITHALKELTVELYLTQVREYKKFLLEKSFENKETILLTPLPRFLWIIRISFQGIPLVDEIYDGTSVLPEKCFSIRFEI